MDENKKIEIIDYYANNISVNTSMFECVMEFGKEIMMEGGKTELEKGVRVRISPQLLKVLSSLLAQSVELYENENGKINVRNPHPKE